MNTCEESESFLINRYNVHVWGKTTPCCGFDIYTNMFSEAKVFGKFINIQLYPIQKKQKKM